MRRHHTLMIIVVIAALMACNSKLYKTNGETIYRTGKDLQGVKLKNRKSSSIPFVQSCSTCHGDDGNKMKSISIQFSKLSKEGYLPVPYTDRLFYRFLDHDLKSDGTKANIGVIWKMSDKDKEDLLTFLKGL